MSEAIAWGSLIGFGLVFLFCTWLLSLTSSLWLTLAASRLRARGAAAEKKAAELALLVPPALGASITISLIGFSLFPAVLQATDHCADHGQHLHLCLFHGGGWADREWALLLVSGLGLLFLLR